MTSTAERQHPVSTPAPASSSRGAAVERVLDLARWAPSGDNSQPWRFEIKGDDHVVVHGYDTRGHCVYDLEGRASQVSVGAMLETMRIAASAEGLRMHTALRSGLPDTFPLIDVRFESAPGIGADPLVAAIRSRTVQRKPLSTRPLDAETRSRLEGAVGPGYSVVWFEGQKPKLRMAWLALRSAKIRLTIPEAYAVHRDIIRWGATHSEDGVPDRALGADALTVRSMRWAMQSWKRIDKMNRYLGGTYAPRLQMDFVPALKCAAHFAIVADAEPLGIQDHLDAGAAAQRFWLTATACGLHLQPQYTPLVFAGYARDGVAFTTVEPALRRAKKVEQMLGGLLGPSARKAVFLGRVGQGPAPSSRSLRLPLARLRWVGGEERPGFVPPPA